MVGPAGPRDGEVADPGERFAGIVLLDAGARGSDAHALAAGASGAVLRDDAPDRVVQVLRGVPPGRVVLRAQVAGAPRGRSRPPPARQGR
jgi:hypothetical protein